MVEGIIEMLSFTQWVSTTAASSCPPRAGIEAELLGRLSIRLFSRPPFGVLTLQTSVPPSNLLAMRGHIYKFKSLDNISTCG